MDGTLQTHKQKGEPSMIKHLFTYLTMLLLLTVTCFTAEATPNRPVASQEKRALQCGHTQDLGERFICQHDELRSTYQEVHTAMKRALKLAPDHIDAQLKQSDALWRVYWPRVCSKQSEQMKRFELECVRASLEERLNLLKRSRVYDNTFLIFPIALYKVTWYEYFGGDVANRIVIYDQVHPKGSSNVSVKSAQRINKRLQPTQENRRLLNDDRALYEAERTFVYTVSTLWGVKERVSEWCIGCNGSDSRMTLHDWFFRKTFKTLQAPDLFDGVQWRSKLIGVFQTSFKICLGEQSYSMYEEYMKDFASNTALWEIESQGLSIEYDFAREDRQCPISWERISDAGISLRFTPQVD